MDILAHFDTNVLQRLLDWGYWGTSELDAARHRLGPLLRLVVEGPLASDVVPFTGAARAETKAALQAIALRPVGGFVEDHGAPGFEPPGIERIFAIDLLAHRHTIRDAWRGPDESMAELNVRFDWKVLEVTTLVHEHLMMPLSSADLHRSFTQDNLVREMVIQMILAEWVPSDDPSATAPMVRLYRFVDAIVRHRVEPIGFVRDNPMTIHLATHLPLSS